MTRIISFAYTTPALLAGVKTVTRREWAAKYANSFRAGELITAYDKSPRVHGKPVAKIRLTAAPTLQPDSSAPDSDYEAEGFGWLERNPQHLPAGGNVAWMETVSRETFDRWRDSGGQHWVVRFELLEVL